MESTPANFRIPAPLPLLSTDPRPVPIASIGLRELCRAAGIALRVTGGTMPRIIVHRGAAHFRTPKTLYVGLGGDWKLDRARALRVLEVLAYSFHDYAARESVCGRGLFSIPQRPGRPSITGRAMTARERMRKMRASRNRAS